MFSFPRFPDQNIVWRFNTAKIKSARYSTSCQLNPAYAKKNSFNISFNVVFRLCFFPTRMLLRQNLWTKISYAFLFPYMHIPCAPSINYFNNIWLWVQTMEILIIQFSPTFCHFLSVSYTCPSNFNPFLFSEFSPWTQNSRKSRANELLSENCAT